MIDDALIVKDTRKVRHAISRRFDNNIDKYVDYLVKEREKRKGEKVLSVKKTRNKYDDSE